MFPAKPPTSVFLELRIRSDVGKAGGDGHATTIAEMTDGHFVVFLRVTILKSTLALIKVLRGALRIEHRHARRFD